ncbi:DJ-1/PfpI family protein [uncultured Cohaesibacter sp.]|uniref:DJ-1/PfpI family protein n=1 Tax=uncultured Cohaesibacter sp. TaxID=1002546 RepID=UPI00292D7F01|nr:DJ-1/PfpI family protein [uncultured Cohaesibacter sp.]
MTKHIGILIFDDVEELDFVGPWEVFSMSNLVGEKLLNKKDIHRMSLISEHDRTVRCAKGMRVLPDRTIAETQALDVLLVPGGQGTRSEVDNPVLIDWISMMGERVEWMTSVCTGSLLLTRAGLTKNRKITTHSAFAQTLSERHEKPDVRPQYRYIRDGNLVTSAGVSAGIDMSLWLVGHWYGPDFARAVQKGMQYDPAPPYQAMV